MMWPDVRRVCPSMNPFHASRSVRKMSTTIVQDIPCRSTAKAILVVTVCALFAFVSISCASPGTVIEHRPASVGEQHRPAQTTERRPARTTKRRPTPVIERRPAPAVNDSPVGRAFENKESDVQVEDEGSVTRLLPDDLDGRRHQRFIVRLESGQTVLVAHNIDLAPRIEGLKEGDIVRFNGEYVWNEKGGVIHWTHHDPQGRHVTGWVKHNGKTFK